MLKHFSAASLALAALTACSSQSVSVGSQQPDLEADVSVAAPRYQRGAGPRMLIDSAHGNLHTIDGSYAPFANLLRNDGLNVGSNDRVLDDAALTNIDVLAIANAEAGGASAFSPEEIATLQRFVERGGALLLIVDHLPYPAAASDLAAAFGVTWMNVYSENSSDGRMTRRSGDLVDDPITHGVTTIRTFGGSCFHAPSMRPLLRAGRGWTIQSATATGLSPEAPADGCLIGAVAEVGEGRVALFAEAAMFTAQRITTEGRVERMGFHARGAEENKTFILNVVHWLVGAN